MGIEFPEADLIANLAHELHDQPSVEDTIEVLVESAPAVVGSESAGTVFTRGGRRWDTGPSSGSIAAKADLLHVELGEGPAITAMEARATILANHLATDGRWPDWNTAAREIGVASVLALRLWTSHVSMGAILFYGAEPDTFDEASIGIAEIIGRHASIAVASARQEESLTRAIDARKLVGQAQGILMERYSLDDRRAFDVLRRYSQATNTKLNEVARILVSTRRLPTDEARGPATTD
jgi:GAF domain-containing protein